MYQLPAASNGRRPRWRVHYDDGKVTITSWYVQVGRTRVAIPELCDIERCAHHSYPIVKLAAFVAGLEAAIALPLAVTYGSAAIVCAGALSAASMVTAVYGDFRRNPRFMSIEATVRGRRVVLFHTRDKREFGQVWRALVRAVEDNSGPRP